jgi:5'-3' exonuclease
MKISQAVEIYVQLRDKKAQLKAEYQDAVAPVQEKMDKLEKKFLEMMNTTGVDSIKTISGTAYTSVKTTASVADKDTFFNYVKDNNEWALMEVRASSTAVKEFVEANEGEIPPGVNLNTERTVNVRRS